MVHSAPEVEARAKLAEQILELGRNWVREATADPNITARKLLDDTEHWLALTKEARDFWALYHFALAVKKSDHFEHFSRH
jgi:hypothetical protein